jgi:hypothetical protein
MPLTVSLRTAASRPRILQSHPLQPAVIVSTASPASVTLIGCSRSTCAPGIAGAPASINKAVSAGAPPINRIHEI